MDAPALRRLLPVVRQMAQRDAEFATWYSRWLERSGWLEGKEALPGGKALASPPAPALSRQTPLQEAVARGDLERTQRVLLEVAAQQTPLQVTVAQDGILREMLRNGWHDLVKQLFPPETDLLLTGTMVAEQLLLGTLLEEQELAYWLNRLCQQNAQKCLGVVRNTARRLSEDASEQAIWLLERALNRFPNNRELAQMLIELYQRTGYAHRAQRLRAQSQPPLPLRDGGEPTTPPEDLPSHLARAEESLQRHDVHLVGVVDATLDMEMDEGTRSQVRDALLQRLTRQRPSLSTLTTHLSISALGRLSSYTVQEGRRVYSFRPRPQGVALWGEVLAEYVRWYPALLPLEGAGSFLLLTGSVYAREDQRDALPTWRALLQTLLDKLGSSPEDLQALAPELLRSVAPAGTAPSDFAEEVRQALQQRERR